MATRFPQQWDEVEKLFPGSSAAFDRDLGERWLVDRDGPRFDEHEQVLHVFVGESAEHGHRGAWATAYFDSAQERWVVKHDRRTR